MPVQRSFRRLTTWLAALALLLVTLAPALSQALGVAGDRAWVEVCSATGSRWVSTDAAPDEPMPASSAKQLLDHCPCCHLHVDSVVPASAPWPALQWPPGLGEVRPSAFLRAPRTLHAWVSAQPRAPPAAS